MPRYPFPFASLGAHLTCSCTTLWPPQNLTPDFTLNRLPFRNPQVGLGSFGGKSGGEWRHRELNPS